MLNKYWPFVLIIALLVALLLVGACGTASDGTTKSTTPTTSVSNVSFSQDIQPIFNQDCVVCHQEVNAPEDLDLEAGVSYQNLVDKASTQSPLVLVSPGNSEGSYLLHKLSGTQMDVGGTGLRMPYNLPPLQQEKLDLVKQWIDEGALNN